MCSPRAQVRGKSQKRNQQSQGDGSSLHCRRFATSPWRWDKTMDSRPWLSPSIASRFYALPKVKFAVPAGQQTGPVS